MKKAKTVKATDSNRLFSRAGSYQRRSDQAANYIRALLFALASGMIALFSNKLVAGAPLVRFSSAALVVVALCILFCSWDIQKYKANERYKLLRDKKEKEFRQFEKKVETTWHLKNYLLDRAAFILILLALLVEMALVWFALTGSVAK